MLTLLTWNQVCIKLVFYYFHVYNNNIFSQYSQKGVNVALLISTDGIKVITPDGQVS